MNFGKKKGRKTIRNHIKKGRKTIRNHPNDLNSDEIEPTYKTRTDAITDAIHLIIDIADDILEIVSKIKQIKEKKKNLSEDNERQKPNTLHRG
jgi:hypothetical protein